MPSKASPSFENRQPASTLQERQLLTAPLISGNLRPFQLASLDPLQLPPGLVDGMSDALHERGLEQWERELDDEKALGFNLLWLSDLTEDLDSTETIERLGGLLDLCARRQVQVLLSVGNSPDWFERLDLADELERVGRNIETLARHFGGHPAFYAWYIPHEIYVAWDAMDAYIRQLYPALVQACRRASPERPVTLSPFFYLDQDQVFGPYRYATPDEYQAYWTELIAIAGFDVIMLQDSGEHFSYVTNAQREPFFQAMHAACQASGARLWGNVEVAEYVCSDIETYVRRYGRIHHALAPDLAWRPVPIDRLESKLRLAAQYSERIVSWGYYQFGRPKLNPEASRWYADYQAYATRAYSQPTQ